MEGVTYEVAAFDSPFSIGNRPARYSYLYLVEQGELCLEIEAPEAYTFTVSEGALITISGLIPHHFRSVGGPDATPASLSDLCRPLGDPSAGEVKLVVSKIQNDILTFISAYLGVRIITADISPLIHQRVWGAYRLIEEELISQPPYVDHAVRLLSENIYLNLMRYNWTHQDQMFSLMEGSFDRRILRAMMEVGKDPCQNWSVERLAKEVGMSRTAFAVMFQKLTGSTPMDSVRRARMAKAIHILDTSSTPIEETAEMCAYASSAAFIRAFKNEYGKTPASWRRGARH